MYGLVIRNLASEIVLQNEHNSFRVLVMPNYRDQKQRKQKRNNETDTTSSHVPAMKEQLITPQKQNKK